MTKKYFGTDGIRGLVGKPPITAEFVMKLGWAVGQVLGNGRGSKILVGKDTRISGYMFESALQAGLSAAGVDCHLLGPMPTPAIAYLTTTFRARAGIVISASHNPYQDNGIKFFSAKGTKLPDSLEHEIESMIDQPMTTKDSADLGKAGRIEDAAGRYIEFCKSSIPSRVKLRGLKVVLDCAHGATYHIAPAVFQELGADVVVIGAKPNGLNINDGYGATDTANLAEKVLEEKADLGIGLDGDGDRVMMIDHTGALVDGDQLMYIIARAALKSGRLQGGVVGTLMSNLGMEVALKELGIGFARSNVGDRHVIALMKEKGWTFGGESSGHIICLEKTSTGDGIISALQVVKAMTNTGLSLADLAAGMSKYPQRMINVKAELSKKVWLDEIVLKSVAAGEQKLAETGRILLRPSGTEPLVRVMVEGEDSDLVDSICETIAEEVKLAAAKD
jgi:phosphoglucosamine mutase